MKKHIQGHSRSDWTVDNIIQFWIFLKIGILSLRIWLKNMKSEFVLRSDKIDAIQFCDFLSLNKNIWSLGGCKFHSRKLRWNTVYVFGIRKSCRIQIYNQILTPINTYLFIKIWNFGVKFSPWCSKLEKKIKMKS